MPSPDREAGGDLGGELKEDKERIEALWDTFKQETRAPAQPLSEPTSKARCSSFGMWLVCVLGQRC